jgi:hypothetical protein
MKNFLLKLIGYRKYKASVYSGTGYTQGIGFDVETDNTKLFGINFVTSIKVSTDSEWMRKLKIRWEEDDKQQLKEKL